MQEFWTISIINIMYTRLQNCTNMMVGEHGIQMFEVLVVVLLLLMLFLSLQVHKPYYS